MKREIEIEMGGSLLEEDLSPGNGLRNYWETISTGMRQRGHLWPRKQIARRNACRLCHVENVFPFTCARCIFVTIFLSIFPRKRSTVSKKAENRMGLRKIYIARKILSEIYKIYIRTLCYIRIADGKILAISFHV